MTVRRTARAERFDGRNRRDRARGPRQGPRPKLAKVDLEGVPARVSQPRDSRLRGGRGIARTREGFAPAGPRRRRARDQAEGSMRARGAAVARRRWQRSYRCLRRAKPGPERSGGTRPNPALDRSPREHAAPGRLSGTTHAEGSRRLSVAHRKVAETAKCLRDRGFAGKFNALRRPSLSVTRYTAKE
jgi:hypothetical protein